MTHPDEALAPLAQQALAAADADYKRRAAEIKALQPLLHQLDDVHQALLAAGLRLYPSNIRLTFEQVGAHRRKVVRLATGGVFGSTKGMQLWLQTLLAAGFTELLRTSDAVMPSTLLRRGTLLLRVDLPRDPAAAAASAAAYAQRLAASLPAGQPTTQVAA